MAPDSNEMLNRVDAVLSKEGDQVKAKDQKPVTLLDDFIIPGLYNAKNTLASLYKYIPKEKSGVMGKVKNKGLNKMKNVVLNVVERESMRQQKFNELTYQAIENLTNEVRELRKLIEETRK